VYNTALKFAPLANYVPSALINCGLNPWSEGHKMMTFPKQSFHTLWKKGKVK
jgi:L-lactate dehydrogenase complex protein LldF